MLKQIGLSVVLVLSSLLVGFASGAEDQPTEFVVQNNSFESAGGNGAPEKWNCSPQYFSVDSGDAHSGNSCLKWSGDGKEYRLCTQTLDIPAGSVVDFSVWVKTKDLKDGKATVCLEWNRQDGTWYGGSYASGIDGTDNEWRQVKSRAFIPKDAVAPHLACYVTQGGSGVAWFDDVAVVKTTFPLFSAITTDRYRAHSDGGKVDVYVGYTAPSDEFDADSLAPKLAVVNSDNEEVASASLEEVVSLTRSRVPRSIRRRKRRKRSRRASPNSTRFPNGRAISTSICALFIAANPSFRSDYTSARRAPTTSN